MPYANDDERWQAVIGRDAHADGLFVCAVKTTGIYCRPSCNAKLPHRANVRFFDNAADARAAGFRSCKLCRPDDTSGAHPDTDMVAMVCRLIEDADKPPSLEVLASAVHLSPSHLRRVFRGLTGLTPRQYADALRVRRMRELLVHDGHVEGAEPQPNIASAVYAAGYGSGSRFYSATRETLGMKPSAYRAGGSGETIRFSITPCYLGLVLVAATEWGLCAVELGDDADALREVLRGRFQRARLLEDPPEFASWVSETVAFIEAPECGLGLPLDIRGSSFQRLVWNALREIRPGSTNSYAEVANRIGRPSSARAVARACASNRLAVVVPCHRVVRADGDVSGYRWGVERKRAILRHEKGPEPE